MFLLVVIRDVTKHRTGGKSSASELFIIFLNKTTVIDNIIIKKGINYLLGDGKSAARSVLPSFVEHKRQGDIP